MYRELETRFNVVYPESANATYESILNYSTEKENPFQRWYRYKEGFSIQFIEKIVSEYGCSPKGVLLDPFAGSGTTILAANRMGYKGIGFEVNPFSFYLFSVKQDSYSQEDIDSFSYWYKEILNEVKNGEYEEYQLPLLSISGKVFQKDAEKSMMSIKTKISKLPECKAKKLLKLGWLACIEELSDYRKAGNGLKKRKTVKPIIVDEEDVIGRLQKQYEYMAEDLKDVKRDNTLTNDIYNKSCLDFAKIVGNECVDGIIFSPPYANCFDYTEIYKLELWFGDFVSDYSDLKVLRNSSLKSHLNVKYQDSLLETGISEIFDERLEKVKKGDLWDKRIPLMLQGYFADMFNVIDNCFKSLKKGGFCAIVVGNSAYSGVVVPTDLILADYANKIGFDVDKIEVDRYIITSSQQYEKTKSEGKYLRESVVCLKKR